MHFQPLLQALTGRQAEAGGRKKEVPRGQGETWQNIVPREATFLLFPFLLLGGREVILPSSTTTTTKFPNPILKKLVYKYTSQTSPNKTSPKSKNKRPFLMHQSTSTGGKRSPSFLVCIANILISRTASSRKYPIVWKCEVRSGFPR